jgi:hypothetical protein
MNTGGVRHDKQHSLASAKVAAGVGDRIKKCNQERWGTDKCDGPDVCANYGVCNQWGAQRAVKAQVNAQLAAAGKAERVPDHVMPGGPEKRCATCATFGTCLRKPAKDALACKKYVEGAQG